MVTRAFPILLAFLASVFFFACGGISTEVASEVRPGYAAIVGVEGGRIIVTNVGPGRVELRRRAASGETVGTTSLGAGETWEGAGDRFRTMEICNSQERPARFKVDVEGANNAGRAQVAVLGQKPL